MNCRGRGVVVECADREDRAALSHSLGKCISFERARLQSDCVGGAVDSEEVRSFRDGGDVELNVALDVQDVGLRVVGDVVGGDSVFSRRHRVEAWFVRAVEGVDVSTIGGRRQVRLVEVVVGECHALNVDCQREVRLTRRCVGGKFRAGVQRLGVKDFCVFNRNRRVNVVFGVCGFCEFEDAFKVCVRPSSSCRVFAGGEFNRACAAFGESEAVGFLVVGEAAETAAERGIVVETRRIDCADIREGLGSQAAIVNLVVAAGVATAADRLNAVECELIAVAGVEYDGLTLRRRGRVEEILLQTDSCIA